MCLVRPILAPHQFRCRARGATGRDRRGVQPVPPGWQITVAPATPTLDPDQSTSIIVTDSPPPGLLGNQVLNLNAFHANLMAGGVTLKVQVA